jgi:hypothetical protein
MEGHAGHERPCHTFLVHRIWVSKNSAGRDFVNLYMQSVFLTRMTAFTDIVICVGTLYSLTRMGRAALPQ